MAFSFSYRGIRSENVNIKVLDISRSILPSNSNITVDIPGRSGNHWVRSEFGMRQFQILILIEKQDTLEDIQEITREVANFIDSTNGLGELIFDDDPNRSYQAIIDEDTNVEQIVRFRRGVLNFISPFPHSESLVEQEGTINGFQCSFSRNSIAWDTNGREYQLGFPRHLEGRFGDALIVEEGTNNGFAPTLSDMSDITNFNGDNASISQDIKNQFVGTYSLRVNCNGNVLGEGVFTDNVVGLSPSVIYSLSMFAVANRSATLEIVIEEYDVGDVLIATTTSAVQNIPAESEDLERIYITFTTHVDHSYAIFYVRTVTTIQYISFWLDGWQIEQKNYITSWHIGNGTRNPENCSFPIRDYLRNEASISQGTIEFDFARLHPSSGTFAALFDWGNFSGGNTVDRIVIAHGTSIGTSLRSFQLTLVNGTDTTSQAVAVTLPAQTAPFDWYRVVARYDFINNDASINIYNYQTQIWYSNSIVLTINPPTFNSFLNCNLGEADSSFWVNAKFDEFRATNRYRTTDEIESEVINNRPMFVDGDRVIKLNMDENFLLFNTDVSNIGTAPVFGIIYIAFGSSGTFFNIELIETEEFIRIEDTFVDGDFVVIDFNTQLINKNNVQSNSIVTLESNFFSLPKDDNAFFINTDVTDYIVKITYIPLWL